MDRQTLRDWVHRYNDEGIDGLKSRSAPGRAPVLTEEQLAELKALVIQGPDPMTHQVVRWRCVDLRAEVARRFSVEVHESTIGKWLHQLGLTRLQPSPFSPEERSRRAGGSKNFVRAGSAMPCSGSTTACSTVEIWFQETRPGSARRAATPTSGRRWARGHRWCATSATTSAYLFGAICPDRGCVAAIIMPTVNTRGDERTPQGDQHPGGGGRLHAILISATRRGMAPDRR